MSDDILHHDSMMKVKTIWDLELLEFKLVAPTFLLESPCIIYKQVNQIKQKKKTILIM